MLKDKTGVTKIDTLAGTVSISGPTKASVEMCQLAIQELISDGYMSMQYEKFAKKEVTVPSSSLPDVIGKKGAIIRKLKEELEVEVNIPESARASGGPGEDRENVKPVKISVVGEEEKVDKA